MNARIKAALEEAAARQARRTPEEQRQIAMMVVLITHVVMCCPREVAPPEYPGRFRWLRDELPAIGAPGCDCKGKGMPVLGPDYFLALEETAAA